MKKTLISRILITVIGLMLSAFTAYTPEFIIIPANTAIMVTLENTIDADHVIDNEAVKFLVERSVVIGYEKLISVKATAYGKIKRNDGNVLEIEMISVQAVDDSDVPIKGTLRKERQSRKGTILIKGGTTIEALVRENVNVKLTKKP